MADAWWRREGGGLRLTVRVQPRAGADRILGVLAGRLRIRIAAAPVEDAANTRLCRFVASLFDVPVAAVRVLQGNRSRDKLLAVDGVQQLPAALAGFAGDAGQRPHAVPRTSPAWLIPLLLLAACGESEAPIPAARPYPDTGFVAGGKHQMHYALTLSRDLPPAIAGSYGIVPRRNLAVLTVALLAQGADSSVRLAPSELSAAAIELTGARRALRFARHDDADGPTYLAPAQVRHRVPVTFEIRARATPDSPEMTARVTREFHLE